MEVRDKTYMVQALAEAQKAAAAGEVPVGAVVVARDHVIAAAHNLREASQDPSAHAEVLAIQKAARTLHTWHLDDCTLYVTLEPCAMCAGLLVNARIKRCVYGAENPKAGALASLYRLGTDGKLNHAFEVTGGVCAAEAASLLREFFSARRD